jgi:muconolactone delta-isomerase
MQQLKTMLVALPEEMSADANAALTADDKVAAGLRDLLAHRLWIKQHAASASRADLDAALAAIDTSREVLAAQLARLDSITGELAAAQSSARSVAPRSKS